MPVLVAVSCCIVDSDVPQQRQVFGSMIAAHPRLVLAEADIQHPEQAVLNPPMGPDRTQHLLGQEREAEEIVARFERALIAPYPFALDLRQAVLPLPA